MTDLHLLMYSWLIALYAKLHMTCSYKQITVTFTWMETKKIPSFADSSPNVLSYGLAVMFV